MGYSVVFTRAAQRDRDAVVEYLVRTLDNPGAAGRFLDELDAIIENVDSDPCMYEAVQEQRLHRQGYRKALFMNYVAVFRASCDVVYIARIFHKKQDYARLL
jgi:plasmid stabilization system protein ParE